MLRVDMHPAAAFMAHSYTPTVVTTFSLTSPAHVPYMQLLQNQNPRGIANLNGIFNKMTLI